MIDFSVDHPPRTTDERVKALRSVARLERELGYVDERVGNIPLPESRFDGHRYDAETPDTLDLTERAVYAINAYTRMLDPALDYAFIGNAGFTRKPPIVTGSMGHGECASKQLESLVLMRIMSGSSYNIGMDTKFMQGILHRTAHDGFCYTPWSRAAHQPGYTGGAPPGKDIVSTTQKPFTSIWEEGRMVLALCMWHQHDENPLWKELIEKKINRMRELAVWNGDTCHYPRRFFILGDTIDNEGPALKGEWALYDLMMCASGLSVYYRLSGYEPALELARGLVRRAVRDDEAYDPEGLWLHNHFHTNTAALNSILEYAATVNDKDLIQFVDRGYQIAKASGEPLVGYYPETLHGSERWGKQDKCETCEVADMLMLGIKLSRLGIGDYWEDVDRCLRNQFVENQITRTDWVERFPPRGTGPLEAGWYDAYDHHLQIWSDETDAVERTVGSWAGWALANDALHPSLMQCCAGNAGRSMYYAWDSIVTRDRDRVSVNLHLNRASPWLDVESHLPYEGKVTLKIKDTHQVSVRIPEWTDGQKVTCMVNGGEKKTVRSENYAEVDGLKQGDVVDVTFPMREADVYTTIARTTYKLAIKGNTVVDIHPQGVIYPLYQRQHYRGTSAPLKNGSRFVPKDDIQWCP